MAVTHGSSKSVVLSFDDGPLPRPALLSIIKTLNVNSIMGEFYVIGTEVQEDPDAANEIVKSGHKIQNHSWDHPKKLHKASKDKVREQLEKTQEAIKTATGKTPTKFRPPYGNGGWNPHDPEIAEVASDLSLTIKNWDIDTEDWAVPKGINKDKVSAIEKQFIKQSAKTLFMVLMHVQPETARDLQGFIDKLKGWGYGFAQP